MALLTRNPRDLTQTLISSLTTYLVDHTSKSKLRSLEVPAPVYKDQRLNLTTVYIEPARPVVLDTAFSYLLLVSPGKFDLTISDKLTSDSVSFTVDRLFLVHGDNENTVYTLSTQQAPALRIDLVRIETLC